MIEPRPLSHWKAIAAMAENRVIGAGNRIPWHLPEDFKWFKKCTLGQIVVMGRRTFESLGKPLPGRTNLVLTREPKALRIAYPALFPPAPESPALPTTPNSAMTLSTLSSIDEVRRLPVTRDVFICGGANVYEQALPWCAELLLTRVKRVVDGDAFFPPFEHLFDFHETVSHNAEFSIERWVRKPS